MIKGKGKIARILIGCNDVFCDDCSLNDTCTKPGRVERIRAKDIKIEREDGEDESIFALKKKITEHFAEERDYLIDLLEKNRFKKQK